MKAFWISFCFLGIALVTADSVSIAANPQLTQTTLADHCKAQVGDPHIVKVTPNIFVAIGYDLANTILIRTPQGNVVVDTGMDVVRAAQMKKDLLALSPGPTLGIILTHTHIDHVGGTSVWAEKETPIWGTAAFSERFLSQYGVLHNIEGVRAQKQYGTHVSESITACSTIGKKPNIGQSAKTGARLPNHTFSKEAHINFGGTDFVLVEAHGETDDELFVWIPSERTLLPGDNFFHAFPNLYTIRGTAPRPIQSWIQSLDKMRLLSPSFLVPSHNTPVVGTQEIYQALTDYRDAIHWVWNSTIQLATQGLPVDEIVKRVKLPEHLVKSPYLEELYGQIDWSVRAIYGNVLGWFDGIPEQLYPLDTQTIDLREVDLMGGSSAVLGLARKATATGDFKWAVHLLQKLKNSTVPTLPLFKEIMMELSTAYKGLGMQTENSNGRNYLFEEAYLLSQSSIVPPPNPKPDKVLLDSIPVGTTLEMMLARLNGEKTLGKEQTLRFAFTDLAEEYYVIVRHGVGEIQRPPVLGAIPKPFSTITLDSASWRQVAIKASNFIKLVNEGKIKIDGPIVDTLDFLEFFDSFRKRD